MTIFYSAINCRQLTQFSPIANEIIYDPSKNYLFDLSYLAGLHVSGERAGEFLQGQLSCDLREVNVNQIRQGALCNLKGRVLSLVDVVNWSLHGLHLILPSDLLLETQASLAKTAMFSRVTLSHAADYHLYGFYLQNRNDVIPFDMELPQTPLSVVYQDNYCCYRLDNHFYIFLIHLDQTPRVRDQFMKRSQWRGSLAWHALQLQQRRIEIYPESRGMFLPHRLSLQQMGYLSFNKGCYKGQEIIARTHYRATLKHELKIFTIETDETLQSGLHILSDNDSIDVGKLVDYCPIGAGKFLIAASMLIEHPVTVHLEGHKHGIILAGA